MLLCYAGIIPRGESFDVELVDDCIMSVARRWRRPPIERLLLPRQYAQNSEVGSQLTDFVVREPWIAVAAAFAIGFVAARLIRRI